MSHRLLIVLPEDGIQSIIDAIDHARRSLRVKMFIFTEPNLLQALLNAHSRGVKVQVMLNPSRTNGDTPNEETKKKLEEAGIEVKDTHPGFKVSHEKSLVVDEHVAFIHSLNWAAHHLLNTRDYAVMTTHQKEVAEITSCFDCDWNRDTFYAGDTAHLVWCPANGRSRVAHFIDEARHSLFIQNDRYQDLIIIDRLMRAVHRGVKVHILSPLPHALKKEKMVEGVGGLRVLHDAGIPIHHMSHLQLHAKLLLADGRRAMIGSINLTTGSFDDRRELAIEVNDEAIIERLNHVAHHDWKHSQSIDLSDKGLYEDLESRGSGGVDKLVLNGKKDNRKK